MQPTAVPRSTGTILRLEGLSEPRGYSINTFESGWHPQMSKINGYIGILESQFVIIIPINDQKQLNTPTKRK